MHTPLICHTCGERPGLWAEAEAIGATAWPAFMSHDPICNRHWGRLLTDFPDFQFVFSVENGGAVAAAHAVPFVWDGDPCSLPEGFDAALAAAVEDREAGAEPTALLGLSIVVRPEFRRRGIASAVVEALSSAAAAKGLLGPVIPVRPTLKPMYPLVPMKRYIEWRRDDGSAFDPWIRLHERLGARILHAANRSMVITGSVAEWEEWAGMAFPESGAYVVPGALTLVTIDRGRDAGEYVEPNVWMTHGDGASAVS